MCPTDEKSYTRTAKRTRITTENERANIIRGIYIKSKNKNKTDSDDEQKCVY